MDVEVDTLTWVLVNQRIISLRSEILVGIPVAFALLGLRIISGLSIVCKKRLLSALFATCSRIKQKVPEEMHL